MKPHVCHVFPAFSTGGCEVRTALILNATADAFRHTVVSLNGDLSGRARVGADVTYVPAPRPGGRLAHFYDLTKLIRGLRPDLLLTYGWGGIDAVLVGTWCGFPRVIHVEDGFLPDEVQRQKLPRLLARRVALRSAARLICPSRTLVRIAARDWCLPPKRISFIPNGVDGRRFSAGSPEAVEAARKRLGLPPTAPVIGTVGQLRPEKNHARLLRVFADAAPMARLLIVGDGPLRGRLEQQARELRIDDRVLFAGAVRDPVDCYRAMDLFALTSDTEQMPIALLEAMSMGLPVVSTSAGDVRTMLSPANRRFVFPLEREDLLAEALAGLLEDADSRRTLGEANREKCRAEFELAAMIQAHLDLYREVLEGN